MFDPLFINVRKWELKDRTLIFRYFAEAKKLLNAPSHIMPFILLTHLLTNLLATIAADKQHVYVRDLLESAK